MYIIFPLKVYIDQKKKIWNCPERPTNIEFLHYPQISSLPKSNKIRKFAYTRL